MAEDRASCGGPFRAGGHTTHGFAIRLGVVRRVMPAAAVTVLVAGCATTPVSRDGPPAAVQAVPESPSSGADVPVPVAPLLVTVEDSARAALGARRLLVPVAGVELARIPDTFAAPRGARTHGALDIRAPRGTPVLSADDGVVLRVSENRTGGLTVYAADPERRLVYYYAHMERYASGVAAGRAIVRGDTLGYVGTTGNAPRDIPHLHFQVMLMHPEGRYWAGTPVNPLPLLLAAADRR